MSLNDLTSSLSNSLDTLSFYPILLFHHFPCRIFFTTLLIAGGTICRIDSHPILPETDRNAAELLNIISWCHSGLDTGILFHKR